MAKAATVKLKYVGPPDQSIIGVGALIPGEPVEVTKEMAEALAGHAWFEGGPKPKAEEEAEDESD